MSTAAMFKVQNCELEPRQQFKHPRHVFTEPGAIMLASVLNSKIAIQAGVNIVRAFVQMRVALREYADLSRKIDELALTYDRRFHQFFAASARSTSSQRAITSAARGSHED